MEGTQPDDDGDQPKDDDYVVTGLEGEHEECIPDTLEFGASEAGGGPDPDPPMCPEHFNWSIHWHVVTSFIRGYDGYKDRWLTGSYLGPQTVTYGQNTVYGNTWGASLAFDAKPVSAAVNYNVTWSSTQWWSASKAIPAGTWYRFKQRQWYHVRVFNAYTKTCLNPPGCGDNGYVFGTAWGGDHFISKYWWERVG